MDSKSILPLILAVALYGCEDTETINESLAAQNELLAAQNQLLEQQAIANSVTLTGSIFNLSTDQSVESANITYKVGTTWNTATSFENGEFEISGLPSNSYIEIKIESLDGSFNTATVNGQTLIASNGITYQNAGDIYVDMDKTFAFSVIDNDTLEPIGSLIFKAQYSYYGSEFNQVEIDATATFNAETSQYEITLPEHQFNSYVISTLDIDADENPDYLNGYYSNYLQISYNELKEELTYGLTKITDPELIEPTNLQLKVSVVDSQLNSLAGATVYYDDLTSTYNEVTTQHEITVPVIDSVDVLVPAFSQEDVNYASKVISITHLSDNTFRVYMRSSNYYYSYIDYEVEAEDGRIDIAVKVDQTVTPEFDGKAELVLSSPNISDEAFEYKLFFSSPIELVEGGISLANNDHIEIVKGNASDNDLVLPGSTTINKYSSDVSYEANLSLNNTLLTLTSSEAPQAHSTYEFEVDYVKDKTSGGLVNVDRSETISYSISTDETFDINDLVLDNNNYSNIGVAIVSENTAGVTEDDYYSYSSAYLYLPDSVLTLKNFILKKISVTQNGVTSEEDYTYNLIENENNYYIRTQYTYQLAHNEQTSGNFRSSVEKGTTLPNGYHYRYAYSVDYMSDDSSSETNEITFEYVYETQEGEIHTGTITLPVQ